MTALLLVDIQNDFLPGGALAVKDGDKILPTVNRLAKQKFDLVVASQDWHPQDHGSFAQTHGKKVGEKVILDEIEQILWPTHCVQNSKGAEFSHDLDQSAIDHVIHKGTNPLIDSYSTFFDNEHKKDTGLHDYLQEHNIKTLYLAGLTTDYCVKYSALDALKLGYDVYVIKDACKAVNLSPNDEKKALEEIEQAGAKIIETQDLLG